MGRGKRTSVRVFVVVNSRSVAYNADLSFSHRFPFFCFVWGVFCFTVCVFECVSLNTYGGSSTCCLGVVVVAVLLFARVQESESFFFLSSLTLLFLFFRIPLCLLLF